MVAAGECNQTLRSFFPGARFKIHGGWDIGETGDLFPLGTILSCPTQAVRNLAECCRCNGTRAHSVLSTFCHELEVIRQELTRVTFPLLSGLSNTIQLCLRDYDARPSGQTTKIFFSPDKTFQLLVIYYYIIALAWPLSDLDIDDSLYQCLDWW